MEEDKKTLYKEFGKDNLIKKLLKLRKLDLKVIIFLAIIALFFFTYVNYQKNQMIALKLQISDQYSMLYDINSNVNYREGRKKLAKTLFKRVALKFNPKLEPKLLSDLANLFYEIGELQYDIKMEVWTILIAAENGFHINAESKAGAIGLMQIMPLTGKNYAKIMGIEWNGKRTLKDPIKNAKIGMRIFYDLVNEFDNNPLYYLTAYNWGPTATRRFIVRKMMDEKEIRKYYLRFLKIKRKVEKIIGYKIIIKGINKQKGD